MDNTRIKEIRKDIGLDIARRGLELGAIRLSVEHPFRWTSGYLMPIYNDNRTYLKDPYSRKQICKGFAQILEALDCSPAWVAGTATAGIPHATTLADYLDIPLCYVLGSSKVHGLGRTIEGMGRDKSFQQDTIILVEDLISTGGSSVRAVQALQETGAVVPYCLAIFSYGLNRSKQLFSSLEEPCTPISLILYDDMISLANELGYIDSHDAKVLSQWRSDPYGWGEQRVFQKKEENI